MLDVTVLLVDGGHASTALAPLEVFRDAGRLWNALQGRPAEPRFRVRTASPGRRAVRPDGPFSILPDEALEDVSSTDLVFVPSTGLDLDAALAAHAELIPFVRAAHARGALVAGVCSGVGLLAAAGILDGRRATTHWGLADRYRLRFPDVRWQPDQLVTDDAGVCCGGGVHASTDLALYVVEKLCGRAVALESALARSWSTCRGRVRRASRCSRSDSDTPTLRSRWPRSGSTRIAASRCASRRWHGGSA